MQQDKDPLGDPRWITAMFAVLGSLYVLTILLNFWNGIAALFR